MAYNKQQKLISENTIFLYEAKEKFDKNYVLEVDERTLTQIRNFYISTYKNMAKLGKKRNSAINKKIEMYDNKIEEIKKGKVISLTLSVPDYNKGSSSTHINKIKSSIPSNLKKYISVKEDILKSATVAGAIGGVAGALVGPAGAGASLAMGTYIKVQTCKLKFKK